MKPMLPGGFVPGVSLLHRLDGQAKVLCLFFLLGGVVAASGLGGFLVITGLTVTAVVLSRLPLGSVLGSVWRLRLFFLFIFLLNAFFHEGPPQWSFWVFRVSSEGVTQGAGIVFRVMLLVILGGILTGTTSPMQLTAALESLMRPLGKLRVPVDEAAMIIGVAIQFIPTLAEEAEVIRKAQTARGARFESRNIFYRAASVLPLAVPVFVAAFRRADELALAMEARGYRNARRRTKKKRPAWMPADFSALGLSAAVLIIQVFVF